MSKDALLFIYLLLFTARLAVINYKFEFWKFKILNFEFENLEFFCIFMYL